MTTTALRPANKPLLSIRPPGKWAKLSLRELWLYRDLLFTFAQRDVKVRYKQTALGVLWVILQPLFAAAIFAFVFGRIANMSPDIGGKHFPYPRFFILRPACMECLQWHAHAPQVPRLLKTPGWFPKCISRA